MATQTTRLLLRKPDPNPSTGDFVNVVTDINDSMDKLDATAGKTVCTSGTRPTGADRWDGREIYETDTRRTYMWANAISTWLPLLVGRGTDGPYLFGQSTDTGGEGLNLRGTVTGADMLRIRSGSDTEARLVVEADGFHNWGSGSASGDTNLYRGGANLLKTDDSFSVGGDLTVTGTTDWHKLDEQTSTGTTLTFSSINQNYRHLLIVGSARGDTASAFVSVNIRINGSSSALYDSQQVSGNNTTAAAFPQSSATSAQIGEMAAASATSGACGTYRISIPNYRDTTFWKTWDVNHTLSTGTGASAMHSKAWSGQYRGTAAITSITLLPSTGNFVTGTRFSLYGLL